jgi:clan AA aspartic protease (TIGR02281 family)
MPFNPTAVAAFLISLVLLSSPLRAAEVPLGTKGGVYTVPVQINRSVNLEFLVDPGASVVVIPVAIFRALVSNRTLMQADILGISAAELADRSSFRAVQVRLRELKISNIVVRDVIAAVSPELSLPLLGQSFLNRFSLVTFDNERRVLILSGAAVNNPQTAPYSSFSAGAVPAITYGTPGTADQFRRAQQPNWGYSPPPPEKGTAVIQPHQ